jgi:glucosylceramidase
MTRYLSLPGFAFVSLSTCALALSAAACSSEDDPAPTGGTGGTGATGGTTGGTGGKSPGTGGTVAGSGTGGTANPTGGTGPTAGTGPGTGGAAGTGATGTGGAAGTGTGGTGAGGLPGVGGAAGTGGTDAGGMSGMAGMGGGGEPDPVLPDLVTSAPGAYWKTDAMPADSTAAATVTVTASEAQTWEGFGGSFNEKGWSVLMSDAMKAEAIKLLFSAAEGANFIWGRIPMGASDYGNSRYTLNDTGTEVDPPANESESNRPPADTALANFSLDRDGMFLIPYIKAAQGMKPNLRFWASPWTPPVWMKTGYMKISGAGNRDQPAVRPSYFDGGTMKNDPAILAAYAQYFKKFVEGYKAQEINVEVVSAQNEPGYDQNYPSCIWEATTYTTFIAEHLGPTMQALGVKVMLGTMSNAGDFTRNDLNIVTAVLANSTAKSFLSVGGAQWGVLTQQNMGNKFGDLPVWATEHKCGNYPWEAGYNMSQAPNDQAYAVESWGSIRDAIKDGKVTAYNAWNMVLDKGGLGIDLSRHWGQNALLVADGGNVIQTPTYYVFRHMSQYAKPGAKVVGTTGGDAVAFKNPDGSIVVTAFNSGAANPNYVVDFGAKKVQFAMPSNGWATVQYKP